MYRVEILLPVADDDKVRYRLLDDISLLGFVVPAGFITDGASTPTFMWPFIPPVDVYFPAAVVHDYLLETASGLRREDIDRIFYQCLKALNIGFFTRYTMYIGVRINSIIKHRLIKKLF